MMSQALARAWLREDWMMRRILSSSLHFVEELDMERKINGSRGEIQFPGLEHFCTHHHARNASIRIHVFTSIDLGEPQWSVLRANPTVLE
jgi:hypothetical protein